MKCYRIIIKIFIFFDMAITVSPFAADNPLRNGDGISMFIDIYSEKLITWFIIINKPKQLGQRPISRPCR